MIGQDEEHRTSNLLPNETAQGDREVKNLRLWLRLEWDRVAAWALVAAGLVILVVGYFGASGTVIPSEQIPYVISGGIGGIFALGLGCMLWLSADLRDEWHKLDRIQATLAGQQGSGIPEKPIATHVGNIPTSPIGTAPAALGDDGSLRA